MSISKFDQWFEDNRQELEHMLRSDNYELLYMAWAAGYSAGCESMSSIVSDLLWYQTPDRSGGQTAWTLFLDDIRYPEDVRVDLGPYRNVIICRTMDDAVWAVRQYGLPTFISFDHDLADTHYIIGDGEKTGYTFAKWFCDYVMDNDLDLPRGFGYYVHSMNPVGAENIRMYMENFLKEWNND